MSLRTWLVINCYFIISFCSAGFQFKVFMGQVKLYEDFHPKTMTTFQDAAVHN